MKEKNDYCQLKSIDNKTRELINRMSNTFFDMFRDINPIFVEENLKKIPRNSRRIIILYYGLDGINCLDYDEIANKLNLTIDEVEDLLISGVENLKKVMRIDNIKLEDKNTNSKKSNREKKKINIYY